MKIYHTETQADYDALMLELEAQGCKWSFGRELIELSEFNNWHISEHLTCLRVYDSEVNHASLNYYKEDYPDIPIEKYKAKVNEMKFTKENVLSLTDKWTENKIVSFQDLQNQIKELDDTPEKVVVPKYVADWIEWNKESEVILQIMLKCYQNYYYNMNRKCQTDEEKAVQWYVDNPYKFIQAYEDGYEVEKELLYYITLPHLETAGGTKQYLTKSGAGNYFALSPCIGQKQRYTKDELEQVPEIYKPFAKQIEGEEE